MIAKNKSNALRIVHHCSMEFASPMAAVYAILGIKVKIVHAGVCMDLAKMRYAIVMKDGKEFNVT